MTTLNQVLQTRGTPPLEICLDWAWQIEDLVDSRLETPLAWSNIALGDEGSLRLIAAGGHHTSTAGNLVDDLLAWSGASRGEADAISAAHRPSDQNVILHLEELTLRIGRTTSPTDEAESWAGPLINRDAAKLRGRAANSGSSQASRSASPLRRTEKHRNRRSAVIAGAICTVPIGLLVMIWYAYSGAPSRQAPGTEVPSLASDSRSPNPTTPLDAIPPRQTKKLEQLHLEPSGLQVTQSEASVPSAFSLAFEEDEPPSLATGSAIELLALPQGELSRDDWLKPSRILDPQAELAQTIDSIQVGSASADAFSAAAAENTAADATHATGTTDAILAGDSTEAPAIAAVGMDSAASTELDKAKQAGAEVDLWSTVEELNVQAELNPSEQELAVAETSEGSPFQEPIVLNTDPMLQVQRFPEARRAQFNKPQWSLMLRVGEGLRVRPEEIQVLTGKNFVQWLILDEEAESPATFLRVVAEQPSQRSPTLRWRILASAEDLPQLALPVAKEPLAFLTTKLEIGRQELQTGVESLKNLGKVSGLPSELRSAASKQRRQLDEQFELSSRLLEIVAEARQIVGWMDGQISVHAELKNSAPTDSTARLQFGNLDQPLSADVPEADVPEADVPEADIPAD